MRNSKKALRKWANAKSFIKPVKAWICPQVFNSIDAAKQQCPGQNIVTESAKRQAAKQLSGDKQGTRQGTMLKRASAAY
jgi:hypothetical protein